MLFLKLGDLMGRVYTNENQILLRQLIEIYQPNGFDWLMYQITKKNTLTLHHVDELSEGGKLSINNAALLTKKSHRALNMCESRDTYLYVVINEFFREVIENAGPMTPELIEESREYKRALTRTLYKK